MFPISFINIIKKINGAFIAALNELSLFSSFNFFELCSLTLLIFLFFFLLVFLASVLLIFLPIKFFISFFSFDILKFSKVFFSLNKDSFVFVFVVLFSLLLYSKFLISLDKFGKQIFPSRPCLRLSAKKKMFRCRNRRITTF